MKLNGNSSVSFLAMPKLSGRGHYLGFELAATSQKVIKVSLIHLEGETADDIELSPTAREALLRFWITR